MAWARSRRVIRKKTPWRRTRRVTRKRRVPLRRRSYRRVPTRRSILNASSIKKRDTRLLATTNNTVGVDISSAAAAPLLANYVTNFVAINGADVQGFLHCPTAMRFSDSDRPFVRNSKACYMVGLKEKLTYRVLNGAAWRHRRICFTMKGLDLVLQSNNDYGPRWGPETPLFNSSPPTGYVRTFNQLQGTPILGVLNQLVFAGASGRDWNTVMTAKTSNSRVSIRYDNTKILQSHNDFEHMRERSFWHKMRKTLVYNDDEGGNDVQTSPFSTRGKEGMGDYWIYDLFEPVVVNSNNFLRLNCTSTLYWHER